MLLLCVSSEIGKFYFLQAFAAEFVQLGVSTVAYLPGFIPEFDVQTSGVRWGM